MSDLFPQITPSFPHILPRRIKDYILEFGSLRDIQGKTGCGEVPRIVSNSSGEPCPDLLQVCPVGPGSFMLVKGEIRELVLSGGFTSGTGDFHN